MSHRVCVCAGGHLGRRLRSDRRETPAVARDANALLRNHASTPATQVVDDLRAQPSVDSGAAAHRTDVVVLVLEVRVVVAVGEVNVPRVLVVVRIGRRRPIDVGLGAAARRHGAARVAA